MDRHNMWSYDQCKMSTSFQTIVSFAQGGSDSGKSWWSQSEQRNKAQKYESALYHQSILSIFNHNDVKLRNCAVLVL